MWINTQTQQRMTESEIRAAHPNTSFASPFNPGAPYAPVLEGPTPVYDEYTQAVREIASAEINSRWYRQYEVVALDAEASAAKLAALAASVRATRNVELALSDFTQLMDYPGQNRAQWASYRQQLRDLPAQAGFPRTVNWPAKP